MSLKMNKKVSILTACYNGAQFIPQYMKYLRNQTYSPLECIIVDDGSTDGGDALLDEYAAKYRRPGLNITVIHQPNTGNAQAISNAYGASSGELIACWDIDDVFFDNNIACLATALMDSPSCAAVISDGYLLHEGEPESARRKLSDLQPNHSEKHLFRNLLEGEIWNWPGTYMVRSSALEQCYGERKIPVPRLWKNSQNLQLLLPAVIKSSRLIPDTLMNYMVYKHSCSHGEYDYQRTMWMLDVFEDIRFQLLELLGKDNEENKRIVSVAFAHRRLREAFSNHIVDDFKTSFLVLKKYKALSFAERYFEALIMNRSYPVRFWRKLLKWSKKFFQF